MSKKEKELKEVKHTFVQADNLDDKPKVKAKKVKK